MPLAIGAFGGARTLRPKKNNLKEHAQNTWDMGRGVRAT